MKMLEVLATRRSVRSYSDAPLEESQIRALLLAAVQAPSAMNRQPWRFAVVQDRVLLKNYSDRAKQLLLNAMSSEPKVRQYEPLLRSPGYDIFHGAPALVAIGSATRELFADADCWLAAQNLMLAAHEGGLGSCCIGFALQVLNAEDVKQQLNFPPNGQVVAAIVIGHPTFRPPAVPRAEPVITAWLRAPGTR